MLKIVLIVILVLGIGVAVHLSQKPQIFKPKAQSTTNNIPSYGSSSVEEIQKYQKPQNHIQIWKFLAFGSKQQMFDLITPYLNYMDYFIYDFHNLIGAQNPDFSPIWDTAKEIKQKAPNLKLGFGSGTIAVPPNTAIYHIFDDSDFMHKADGSFFDNGGATVDRYINLGNPVVRQKVTNFYLDVLTNKGMDMVFRDSYGAVTPDTGFNVAPDGCSDTAGDCRSTDWWYDILRASSQETFNVLPPGKDFTYNGVWYPGPGEKYGGVMNTKHLDYHSGALSEWIIPIIVDKTQFKSYLETFTNMVKQGKKVFAYYSPGLMCPTDYRCTVTPTLTDSDGATFTKNVDNDLQRYYLAYYLLYQKNPYTYFGYHPGNVYIGYPENWGGQFFYADWYKDYGEPVGNGDYYTFGSPDMYWRLYTKGYAVVNNSTQPLPFGFPANTSYREWDPYNGPVVSGTITIPPKSGKFFFSPLSQPGAFSLNPPEAFCSGTNSQIKLSWTTPSNEPTPLDNSGYFIYIDGTYKYNNLHNTELTDPEAKNYNQTYTYKIEAVTSHGNTFSNEQSVKALDCSTSSSPSPARKVGDLNNDGQVNIFDFNIFIQDYSSGNLRSDLNSDSKVNIFDFNILVSGFGK